MAPPSEAHGRMSYALKELRRYLIPDANDEISQEQLRELESYGGVEGNEEAESKPRSNQAPFRGISSKFAMFALYVCKNYHLYI